MKLLLSLLVVVALCGCRTGGEIACIPHADGRGVTKVGYVAIGGGTRPGVMIVYAQSYGDTNSRPPQILTTAHGAPLAPAVFGATAHAAGDVGAALALGTTWPDQSDNTTVNSTVTPPNIVIPNPPPAGPIPPPRGPPPGRPRSPHNGGR